jgi:hypothetical protein
VAAMTERTYKIHGRYRIVTPLGHTGQLCEALVPLTCAGCGVTIRPGVHFTRHRRELRYYGTSNANEPFCGVCYPFRYAQGWFTQYREASVEPVPYDSDLEIDNG